ncbi:MAG: sigma-70 family RNA polymerase sigma factor [Psychrobium sp.]|nr:sigma-70 family RNA polymerase sigma factor [Psychrobium sp.]
MDVFQETLLRVIVKHRAGQLLNPNSLKYYIIANHLIIQVIKCRQLIFSQTSEVAREELFCQQTPAVDVLVAVQDKDFLTQTIANLSAPLDMMILQHYFIEQRDKIVICAELNLSATQFDRVLFLVKSRLKSALLTTKDD